MNELHRTRDLGPNALRRDAFVSATALGHLALGELVTHPHLSSSEGA
jgi:hypothetical protein